MKLTLALSVFAQAVVISTASKDCSKTDEWDVIVVGSGLSGSIVASKLAKASPDKCILIVEGGKDSGQILDHEDADVAKSHNGVFEEGWNITSAKETLFNTPGMYDQLVCWNRECDYVWGGNDDSGTPTNSIAGRLVGGSGAINGALMQYPPDRNFDPYPNGWKADDMRKYLKEVEETMQASSTPSTDGKHYNDEHGATQVKKAMEDSGFQYSIDGAYTPKANHMGIPRVTTRNGRRASSTSVFLKPALENLSNVKLWTETEVREIVLDESNMTAKSLKVSINGKNYSYIHLAEKGLLVLSGGGVKTPQLLLDSGIGPGLKVDNKYVGKGLTDKTVTWLTFISPNKEDIVGYNFKSPPEKDQKRFLEHGEGPLTQFGPLLVGFIDPELSEDPSGTYNIVEFFVSAQPGNGVAEDPVGKVKVFFVHLTPKNDGGQTILPGGSTDGSQFNTDYSDKSFKKAAEVVTEAMKKHGYVREVNSYGNVNPMNHPAGSCALDKCIDSANLLVKGLNNVAVVDHSIVPEQAVVHSAFALMALALKGADILEDFVNMASQNDEL